MPVFNAAAFFSIQGSRLLRTRAGVTTGVTTFDSPERSGEVARLLNQVAGTVRRETLHTAACRHGDISGVRRAALTAYAAAARDLPDPVSGPRCTGAARRRVHELGAAVTGELPPVRNAVKDAVADLYPHGDLLVILEVADSYDTVEAVMVGNDWLETADDDELAAALCDGDDLAVVDWLCGDPVVEPVRQAARVGDNGWQLTWARPALDRWLARHHPTLAAQLPAADQPTRHRWC